MTPEEPPPPKLRAPRRPKVPPAPAAETPPEVSAGAPPQAAPAAFMSQGASAAIMPAATPPPRDASAGAPPPEAPSAPQGALPEAPPEAPPAAAPESTPRPAAGPAPPARRVALVLSGGVGLGAYHAGAFRALAPFFAPDHIAATSIGAVNGAIIAGNAPEGRADALDAFWNGVAAAFPAAFPGVGEDFAPGQPWRRAASWAGAIQSRLAGRPGLFSPQIPAPVLGSAALGLYTLAPLTRMLERFVDFDRLNAGGIRLSVLATDLATGEPVFFDTARGETIGPEHILASCGFVPEFAPTEIDGRLLGDGGFAANAPLEAAFEGLGLEEDMICFVLDLFARDVGPPRTLTKAGALHRDLLFCNPTHRTLDALRREDALRRMLAEAGGGPVPAEARRGATAVLHLSYLPASGEASVERHFDFSRASLDARRRAGAEDMARALQLLGAPAPAPGFTLHRVRR